MEQSDIDGARLSVEHRREAVDGDDRRERTRIQRLRDHAFERAIDLGYARGESGRVKIAIARNREGFADRGGGVMRIGGPIAVIEEPRILRGDQGRIQPTRERERQIERADVPGDVRGARLFIQAEPVKLGRDMMRSMLANHQNRPLRAGVRAPGRTDARLGGLISVAKHLKISFQGLG